MSHNHFRSLPRNRKAAGILHLQDAGRRIKANKRNAPLAGKRKPEKHNWTMIERLSPMSHNEVFFPCLSVARDWHISKTGKRGVTPGETELAIALLCMKTSKEKEKPDTHHKSHATFNLTCSLPTDGSALEVSCKSSSFPWLQSSPSSRWNFDIWYFGGVDVVVFYLASVSYSIKIDLNGDEMRLCLVETRE